MGVENIIFELAVVIVGAAVLGTLFLYAKQPIIIAYIAIGIIVGPGGLGLMGSTEHIEHISHLGIILLLFLIGLNLQPEKLIKLFRRVTLLVLATSAIFMIVSFVFALFILRFTAIPALIFGVAMMFSSTVVGLKLIPTTTLHHKHKGEIMTSILLVQDVLAILVILFLSGEQGGNPLLTFSLLIAKFAALSLAAFAGVRFVMSPLLMKFDVVQEYAFLTTLAWCLLWAELAHMLGLSYEMGAFLAGISIASCRVAMAIAEHLKPLREFFLILFFFAIGSKIDLRFNPLLLAGAVAFGIFIVFFKSMIFRIAFRKSSESAEVQNEISIRLAQASEFSLLVAFTGASAGLLTHDSAMAIQIATVVTFSISTYWVVRKYTTPI